MRKPLFGPSLEMIAFQSTMFGELLTGVVEDIRNDVKSGKLKTVEQMNKALEDISRLIKKQTNLTIKVEYLDKKGYGDDICIYLPLLSLNHIFNRYADIVNYIEKKDTDAIVSALKKFKDEDNWIDTEKVWVSGAFAAASGTMVIGSDFFIKNTVTPEELVSMILHEVGHMFYNLEYMDRASTTNQMLAGFAMEEFQQLPPGKRKVIFQKAQVALQKSGIKELPLDALAEAKTTAETTTIFLTSVFDANRSHTDTPYYDFRANEALADNFCARYGFAKHLTTCLAKLGGGFNKKMYYELQQEESTSALGLLVMGPLMIAAGVVGSTIAAAGATGVLLIGVLCTVANGIDLRGQQKNYYAHNQELYYSYDDLRVRMQRLREQVVAQLKNTSNKKLFTRLIQDIAEMDKVIADTPLPAPSLITKVFEYFDSSRRQARDYRALQRLLEEFAANDLFINAAKLQSIK